MDTADTEISLLGSEADLTEIHAQSDLPFSHERRRTKTGFLVSGDRLAAFVPTPPGKREDGSWVWKHGEHITRKSDAERRFLCRICYDDPKQSLVTDLPNHTLQIARHLRIHGFDIYGNKTNKRKRQEEGDVGEQLKAQATVFDRNDWHTKYVKWMVMDDVPLERSVSKPHKDLLIYRNPFMKNAVPDSRNTTRKWIIRAFHQSKSAVRRSLATSKSRITLSFDAWKSGNELDLLGVVAHYIDRYHCVKNVLLALRNTYGSHKGEEVHHHLLAVCRDYRIGSRIAYIMADNASSNDTAIELLQSELSINLDKQRLRCAGHVINLVCKAILYGTDTDCIEDVIINGSEELYDSKVSHFETELRAIRDEKELLKIWRKKGPIGKLHNIIIHATTNPARREFFKAKQKEAIPDAVRLYQLVINGGIRWNSTCDMLERAFKLKDAIELYCNEFRSDDQSPLENDCLTTDDWLELRELLNLLQPLKQVSLYVQTDGKDSRHGSLFENLQAIDYLLTELETLKRDHQYQPSSHYKACINLGWKKLNKYYELSDVTPAYRAAIAVHPCFKMRWFEKQWRRSHPHWIDEARDRIRELFDEYKRRHCDDVRTVTSAQRSKELTKFERYNMCDDDVETGDDLERFLREERAPKGTNPLAWWQLNEERYPVLCHMAYDLFAAPASTAADERQFSMAGHVLDEEHWNTKDDLAEAHQCLKSAFAEQIDVFLSDCQYTIRT